jgi:hypothetical protein
MREAVGLGDTTASMIHGRLITTGKRMSDTNKKAAGRESGNQPIPGQGGLPYGHDAADAVVAPDVQANGRAASNGQSSGLATSQAGASQTEADPFDLASLRLSQDYASAVGVRRLITTIPVRKPSKEWFVRTHPDPAYRLQTAVLELKEDREVYLVAPGLWPGLASETTFSPRLLVTSINRQGVPFLWPIRLPGADGKIDDWSRSAMDAADEAKSRWVRIVANMSLGAYDVAVASGQVAEPTWPDIAFQEIIRIAFRDKMISERDHPVLRRLRGEV